MGGGALSEQSYNGCIQLAHPEGKHRRAMPPAEHPTVETFTADVTHLQLDRRFDRIVSIEMFEHMKNYERLMSNLTDCLKPGGKLFVHMFSHREFAYEYDTSNPNTGVSAGCIMAERFEHGLINLIGTSPRFERSWPAHTAQKRKPCGWSTGDCFSWPARKPGTFLKGKNTWYHIIFSINARNDTTGGVFSALADFSLG
jgi:hypothetical protein